jgi:hypothetical protein
MINREPGFLVVVCFGSSPTPLPHSRQQVVYLSQSSFVSQVESILTGDGGWSGGGAKSYDGEKAFSSVKHCYGENCMKAKKTACWSGLTTF